MKVHLCGNVYETDDLGEAERLAALLNQELFTRLTCGGCQRMLEIPVEIVERMPSNIMVTPAEEGVWHRIYNLTCDTEKWLCTECWLECLADNARAEHQRLRHTRKD